MGRAGTNGACALSPLPPLRCCTQALMGSPDKAAEAGHLLFDLRACRPGLPAKCKVYTLALHPFRAEICVAGTNIGLFVLAVAPHYTVGSCCAPLAPLSQAGVRGGGSPVRPPRAAPYFLHVTPAGALVASEVSVTLPAAPPPYPSASIVPTARGSSEPVPPAATAELRTSQKVLLQVRGTHAPASPACCCTAAATSAVARATQPPAPHRVSGRAYGECIRPAAQPLGDPVLPPPRTLSCRRAPRDPWCAPAGLGQRPVPSSRVARAQVPRPVSTQNSAVAPTRERRALCWTWTRCRELELRADRLRPRPRRRVVGLAGRGADGVRRCRGSQRRRL